MATRTKGAAKATKKKGLSKAQVVAALAEKSGLTKVQVTAVFEALDSAVMDGLRRDQVFTIPGLVKISVVRKKATPARPGRNPFTGEAITISAKPAQNVVRVRALKHLKDMA